MKRKNKLLIALLSVSCLTAGAFGLVACNNEQADNRDQSIVAVYNQYVAHAESEGQTPLTYDEWLASIKGADGKDGKDGKDGTNGKSAYEIYCEYVYKNNGNPLSEEKWLESLTGNDGQNGKSAYDIAVEAGFKGTKEEWLESLKGDKGDKGDTPVVHVHTYAADAEVTTVVEPTTTNPGIGYIYCSDADCDHIELVVLNTYSYMVRLYDVNTKEPVKGATVNINETELTTDESGVVIFKDMQKGEYDVVVSKSGYGLAETYKTSTTKTDFEIALYPAPSDVKEDPETQEEYFVPAVGSNVGDKVSYYMTAVSSWFTYYAPNAVFKVENGKIVKYKVTVYGLGAAQDANYNQYFEGESFNFVATSDYTVKFSASERASGDFVNYIVTFERMEAPALGSSAEAGMLIDAEKYVNFDVAPGTVVHFIFNGEGGKYQLSCQANTTVNYNGTSLANESVIKHSGYSKSYFTATSTGSSIGFKLTRYYEAGEKENPVTLTLGAETESAVDWNNGMFEAWYKFDVETAGRYTVEGIEGSSYNFELYNNVNGARLAYTYSRCLISDELNVGTYYVKTTQPGKFKVRAYDENTDLGLISKLPKTVTAGNVALLQDTMYLKYEVTTTGYVSILGTNSDFIVYSDDSYVSGRLFASYETNLYTQVTAGDTLYIKADMVDKEKETASITIYNLAEAPETVNYKFKVVDVDGNALGADFKVIAKLGGEEVGSGTTASDGTVTLALAPNVYAIFVEVGEKDYEYIGNINTKNVFGDTEVALELAELVQYTVTVKDASGKAASGIEVVLKNASTTKSCTAITDDNGIATFKVSVATYAVSVVSDTYEVSGNNNYIYDSNIISNGNFDVSLALKPVALKNGMSVTAGTVYTFSASSINGTTVTVASGYIVSYKDPSGTVGGNVNYVTDGIASTAVEADGGYYIIALEKDSNGKVTSLGYYPMSSTPVTVVFSEDTTVTLE